MPELPNEKTLAIPTNVKPVELYLSNTESTKCWLDHYMNVPYGQEGELQLL